MGRDGGVRTSGFPAGKYDLVGRIGGDVGWGAVLKVRTPGVSALLQGKCDLVVRLGGRGGIGCQGCGTRQTHMSGARGDHGPITLP